MSVTWKQREEYEAEITRLRADVAYMKEKRDEDGKQLLRGKLEIERLRVDLNVAGSDADRAWAEVERLRREKELLGRGHTGVAAAVAAEYENKALKARLREVVEALDAVRHDLGYHYPALSEAYIRARAALAAAPQEEVQKEGVEPNGTDDHGKT